MNRNVLGIFVLTLGLVLGGQNVWSQPAEGEAVDEAAVDAAAPVVDNAAIQADAAAAEDAAAEAEDNLEYTFGSVTKKEEGKVTINEYDYDQDKEVEITYTLDPDTQFEFVESLVQINLQDMVSIYYEEVNGEKIAKTITLEVTDEEQAADAPAAEDDMAAPEDTAPEAQGQPEAEPVQQ